MYARTDGKSARSLTNTHQKASKKPRTAPVSADKTRDVFVERTAAIPSNGKVITPPEKPAATKTSATSS